MEPTTCSITSCARPVRAKGYCIGHYNRSLKGQPLDTPFEPRQKAPADGRCTVTGCDQPYLASGYCAAHWKRAKAGKDMTAPVRPNPRGPAEERFEKFVQRTDGCWLWTGGQFGDDGYGAFWDGHRHRGAHTFAWALANGREPAEGMYVLHTCDNPPCVRPDHLYEGTPLQNMQDKVTRGRVRRGSSHGLSRVTESDVQEIRNLHAAGISQKILGERFGISQAAVSQIVRRHTWTHVR